METDVFGAIVKQMIQEHKGDLDEIVNDLVENHGFKKVLHYSLRYEINIEATHSTPKRLS